MDENLLIRRCQAGDSAACAALLARHEPWIRQRARRFAVAGIDWDDLMQEGRIGLYRAINEKHLQIIKQRIDALDRGSP
jgi:RNA polymerase sporulation-specific sigma factor